MSMGAVKPIWPTIIKPRPKTTKQKDFPISILLCEWNWAYPGMEINN